MSRCLCIVGNEGFTAGAGARIRYFRLRNALAAAGWTLSMRTIDSFATKNTIFDDNAYLISKVYDHRSVVLAHAARRVGRPVGIDLLDDYFTGTDPRLTPQRSWLRAVAEQIDFALVSTSTMAQSIGYGADGARVTVAPRLAQALRPDWRARLSPIIDDRG